MRDAIVAEKPTMDSIEVALRDINYPDPDAVNRVLKEFAYAHKYSDGRAAVLAQELAQWEKALLTAREWVKKRSVKQGAVPVFNRTTGILTLRNGRTAKLDGGEKYLLTRLVELGSASGSELKDAHARPDKALRALIRKYHLAKYISLPGGPGKGGYSTTIELDESP